MRAIEFRTTNKGQIDIHGVKILTVDGVLKLHIRFKWQIFYVDHSAWDTLHIENLAKNKSLTKVYTIELNIVRAQNAKRNVTTKKKNISFQKINQNPHFGKSYIYRFTM